VYALEATFRGAANAAARDGKRERLERWPREERRLAEAKILLLSTDGRLNDSLERLTRTGRDCSRAALHQEQQYPGLSAEHRKALTDFAEAARSALRQNKVI
jgi:hypothetical protein